MSDKITIDQLKIFVGTGLKINSHKYICDIDECVIDCCGLMFDYRGDYDSCYKDIDLSINKPIVRPWSHLTKEIEHNGERFVPILKLLNLNTTTRGDDLCKFAAKKTLERVNNKSISYSELSELSYWHFDVFNWLSRTGEDGQPLAIEMKL